MDRVLVLSVAAALLAGSALAGPEQMIKQRAKELRDQNNLRQGVPPPVQPAATPGAPTPTAPQPQSLTRLHADLAAITANSPVTPQTKQQLATDLIALAQGPAKPSPATAAKLAEDLSAALAEKSLPATSRSRLVQEFDAVLNPTKYPQAKMDGIFTDIQAIFLEKGLKRNKPVVITDDLKAMAGEVHKSAGR